MFTSETKIYYLTVPALLVGELIGGGIVWCRIFEVDIGLFFIFSS